MQKHILCAFHHALTLWRKEFMCAVVDSAPGRLCFGNDVLSCIEIYIRAFMLLSILLFHLFISFIREIPLEKEAGI